MLLIVLVLLVTVTTKCFVIELPRPTLFELADQLHISKAIANDDASIPHYRTNGSLYNRDRRANLDFLYLGDPQLLPKAFLTKCGESGSKAVIRCTSANYKGRPLTIITFDFRDLYEFATRDSRCNLEQCQSSNWQLQEPLTVDEPQWVMIEPFKDFLMRPLSTRDDPFFIARGKRQLPKDDDDVQFKQRTSENGEKFVTSRVKREAAAKAEARNNEDRFTEAIERFLYKKRPMDSFDDKISDVIGTLNEPFFVSRGKKTLMLLRGWNEKNKRPKAEKDSLKELLKDYDPFYGARGKRLAANEEGAFNI